MAMKWSLSAISDFDLVKATWDTLNHETFRSPVLCSDFVIPLISEFSSGNEVVALLSDERFPVAIGIFRKTNFCSWETFQPSQAPLGLWLCCPTVDLNSAIYDLADCLEGKVLLLGIMQQDPELFARPADRNFECLDYIQTARITVQGSFDDYWSKRGKNLRHNMNRQRKRLAKEGIIPELEMVDAVNEVQESINLFGQFESRGWKSDTGTAVSINNAQGRFYQSVLERMCEKSSARIYKYYYGQDIVCIDLCIHLFGTLIILKTTYDESIKTSSPAFLMRQETFQSIFEQREFDRIEFYGRLMDWHTKWSDEVRTMFHLNWYKYKSLEQLKKLKNILKPKE